MKLFKAEEMRRLDREATELYGIPSILLMENAALACVREILKLAPRSVGIFCGKGNNGGDGLAVARHLMNRGIKTVVYTVCGADYTGDALVNYEIYEKMGGVFREFTEYEDVAYDETGYELLVDAIFGTGFRGEVHGNVRNVMEAINRSGLPVLSVDVPSGVSADDGMVASCAVRAERTVTFAGCKRGLMLYPGAQYVGKLIVADISIPQTLIDRTETHAELLDSSLSKQLMPRRVADSHKGNYGKVLILGGARGMCGAVCMAAEAAMRAGAGLVLCGVPESNYEIAAQKLTEAMTMPLAEVQEDFSEDGICRALEKLAWCDAVLIGPGLGKSVGAAKLLKQVLAKASVPIVVDADALNCLAEHMDYSDVCSAGLIFTPHTVEFSRLSGLDLDTIQTKRMECAAQFAQEHGVTLILKGAHTVITAPDGSQRVNTTGNAGMATGGSGDVLAGMTAALAARGLAEEDAAALAVYLHGAAGDLAAEALGEESLCAGDLIRFLPKAIRRLQEETNSENYL